MALWDHARRKNTKALCSSVFLFVIVSLFSLLPPLVPAMEGSTKSGLDGLDSEEEEEELEEEEEEEFMAKVNNSMARSCCLNR